jgi:hypothetical protein
LGSAGAFQIRINVPMIVAGTITAASGSIAPIALPASSDRRLMPIASSGRSVP